MEGFDLDKVCKHGRALQHQTQNFNSHVIIFFLFGVLWEMASFLLQTASVGILATFVPPISPDDLWTCTWLWMMNGGGHTWSVADLPNQGAAACLFWHADHRDWKKYLVVWSRRYVDWFPRAGFDNIL